jgi:SAM-dependent methyltransferase
MKAPARACPVCDGERQAYRFLSQGFPVHACLDCGMMFVHPQPALESLARLRAGNSGEADSGRAAVRAMTADTAQLYLRDLLEYHGAGRGRLLEVGCGRGDFLAAAQGAGFDVEGLETDDAFRQAANLRLGGERVRSGRLDDPQGADGSFDVCALFDVVDHVPDPIGLLRRVRALLKPGGTLFVVAPSRDSYTARWLKQDWLLFKSDDLFFFDDETLRNALAKTGFQELVLSPNRKVLTAEYLHWHFGRFPTPYLSPLAKRLYHWLPGAMRQWRVQLPSSGVNVLCRPAPLRPRPLLSVIVPVYNERATFTELMDALLAKEVPGLDREVIVVESRSTDGTRELVRAYEGRPGVRIEYEEAPKGKGHAVRTGLALAQGDIVLIQDADLEYDLNDYDELLQPILRHQRAFVLGSRHTGDWKIRKFNGQPVLTSVVNTAHLFFAFLLNTACGSHMKDPFTMFKVFRRDCIHGLTFKADRFDFDWELVIKLLRKGYMPVEVPVNYLSRSFKEGKKIRTFRDPPTWVWALIRFRLAPLYEKKP